MATNKCI